MSTSMTSTPSASAPVDRHDERTESRASWLARAIMQRPSARTRPEARAAASLAMGTVAPGFNCSNGSGPISVLCFMLLVPAARWAHAGGERGRIRIGVLAADRRPVRSCGGGCLSLGAVLDPEDHEFDMARRCNTDMQYQSTHVQVGLDPCSSSNSRTAHRDRRCRFYSGHSGGCDASATLWRRCGPGSSTAHRGPQTRCGVVAFDADWLTLGCLNRR